MISLRLIPDRRLENRNVEDLLRCLAGMAEGGAVSDEDGPTAGDQAGRRLLEVTGL